MGKIEGKLDTDSQEYTPYDFAAILELHFCPSHVGKFLFFCMTYMFSGNIVAKLIKVITVLFIACSVLFQFIYLTPIQSLFLYWLFTSTLFIFAPIVIVDWFS